MEESKKYTNRKDFAKYSPSAYYSAQRNGWLDDDNIKRNRSSYGYWNNLANIIKVLGECSNIKEFSIKYPTAYYYTRTNKWLDEIKSFFNVYKEYNNKYSIYVYIDDENKCAYVGLTCHKEERHNSHINGTFKTHNNQSQVYKHFHSLNKEIPKPIYLEENLTSKTASEREEYWKNYYENNLGYSMLNIAKCGGLGARSKKWTKEKVFEVSKLFTTKTEFSKKYPTAYSKACKNKWIGEMVWLKKRNSVCYKWSVSSILEEIKKYKTYKDFREKSKSCYNSAIKNKLLNTIKKYYLTNEMG